MNLWCQFVYSVNEDFCLPIKSPFQKLHTAPLNIQASELKHYFKLVLYFNISYLLKLLPSSKIAPP